MACRKITQSNARYRTGKASEAVKATARVGRSNVLQDIVFLSVGGPPGVDVIVRTSTGPKFAWHHQS
jgi:hypothetical protein